MHHYYSGTPALGRCRKFETPRDPSRRFERLDERLHRRSNPGLVEGRWARRGAGRS